MEMRNLIGLFAIAFAVVALAIGIRRLRRGPHIVVRDDHDDEHDEHKFNWLAMLRSTMINLIALAIALWLIPWGTIAFLSLGEWSLSGFVYSATDDMFAIVYGFVALVIGCLALMVPLVRPFAGHGHGHEEDSDEHEKYAWRAWAAIFPCQLVVWYFFGVVAARVVNPSSDVSIWGLIFMAIAIPVFYHDAFKTPEHNPPSKSQIAWLGMRLAGRVLNEGWGWLPLRKILFTAFPISVKQIHLDFGLSAEDHKQCVAQKRPLEEMLPGLRVWTPLDKQRGKVRLGVTLEPYDPLKIANLGDILGVIDRFDDRAAQYLWEWSTSTVKGPQEMGDLQKSPRLAVNALLRAFAPYNVVNRIDSPIPTEILLQYFDYAPGGRPPSVPSSLKKVWGANWERVEQELDEGETSRRTVEKQVRARMKMIDELSRSTCRIKIPELGCYLVQLNWKGVVTTKAFAEAQAKWGIEREERRAERLEQRHALGLIGNAVEQYDASFEQARRFVMGERKKSTVTDNVLSLELGEGAKELAAALKDNPGAAAALGAAFGARASAGGHGGGKPHKKKGGGRK